MAGEEKKLVSCLKKEEVVFKFIPRMMGGVTDNPKHVAYGGMLDTAFREFCPGRLRSGQLQNILTEDEKDFLEEYLRLEKNSLSMYNKEYWDNINVRLYKENNRFDLSNPDDYIKVKVLLSNKNLIAKSKDLSRDKRTYMFYMEKEGDEDNRKVSKLNSTKLAYKLYGKYEDNIDVLRYVLKTLGKATKRDVALGKVQTMVGDVLDVQAQAVSELLDDRFVTIKAMLSKAVENKVISIRRNVYYYNDGKPLTGNSTESTLQYCAEFLSEPINQDKKLIIEAGIK